jgi:hypothetical protein
VNLTVQIFPALQHLAKLTRLRMYYGDHTCCERWIISSVKILLALGATREAMLNDQ